MQDSGGQDQAQSCLAMLRSISMHSRPVLSGDKHTQVGFRTLVVLRVKGMPISDAPLRRAFISQSQQ